MSDTYGSNHREMMKEILSKSAGERRARYVPTFWDKNHAWIGQLCWAIVGAFVGVEVIILYGTRWPR